MRVVRKKIVLDKRLQDIRITETVKNGSVESMSELKEEGSRTQYTPQVRILKRSTDDTQSAKDKSKIQVQPQKTLQQREAEYKEARLRILGEDYSGADDNSNNNSAPVAEPRPVKLIKPTDEVKLQEERVQLLREPKGPDGTGGFDQNR